MGRLNPEGIVSLLVYCVVELAMALQCTAGVLGGLFGGAGGRAGRAGRAGREKVRTMTDELVKAIELSVRVTQRAMKS